MWTCIPFTFSPEQGAASLRIFSLGTPPSPRAKSSLIPAACSYSGSLTEFYRCFPFGTMLEPCALTTLNAPEHLPPGEPCATILQSAGGSHVRTFQPPEKAPASPENEADSGLNSLESFARFDPETSSWKTRQCSLDGGLESYSETWPRWGTMRCGAAWAQNTPLLIREIDARIMSEIASGYLRRWPTPTVCGNYNRKGASKSSGYGLATRVRRFPTPTACMSKGSSPAALKRKDGTSRAGDRLDHNVMESHGGQLNPEWVEWLMGWPIGHTDCQPLATDRYPHAPQWHGAFCKRKNNHTNL
jgi:hypothetical protein